MSFSGVDCFACNDETTRRLENELGECYGQCQRCMSYMEEIQRIDMRVLIT